MRMGAALMDVTTLSVATSVTVRMGIHLILMNTFATVLVLYTVADLYDSVLLLFFTCTDVDECKEGTAECDTNASCNNTIGGYNCSCNSGYEGDGFNGNCSSE